MTRRQDSSRPRVTVIGAGSWGTTFGKILADGGAHVTMWARRPELAAEIQEAKRNTEYLPGVNLPRDGPSTPGSTSKGPLTPRVGPRRVRGGPIRRPTSGQDGPRRALPFGRRRAAGARRGRADIV